MHNGNMRHIITFCYIISCFNKKVNRFEITIVKFIKCIKLDCIFSIDVKKRYD